jgi:hypothetical protein
VSNRFIRSALKGELVLDLLLTRLDISSNKRKSSHFMRVNIERIQHLIILCKVTANSKSA